MPLTTAPLFLAEITAYDPRLGTTRVLRYASGTGYTTGPSATPANTFYDARISQPVDISRTMFSGGTTMGRSTVGLGDLVLNNADGLLDDLNDYGFDGQAVTIYRTTTLNPSYPADFTTVLVGTMSAAEFTADEIRIKLRDKQQILADTPFQTTKYAGTNSLPSGLEGVATDLKGKPKPVLYGTVKNIAPPCVNTSKLIYQVNDGAISTVDAVYDRGVSLIVGFPFGTPAGTTQINRWRYLNSLFMGSVTAAANDDFVSSSDAVSFSSTATMNLVCQKFNYSSSLAMLCAVGANTAGSAGKIATSTDNGATWTLRTNPLVTISMTAVAFGAGLWVAIAYSGGASTTVNYATSSDGITWSSQSLTTSANTQNVYCDLAFGNGLFVFVTDGGQILTSSNGTSWTQQTSPFASSEHPLMVDYVNGVWFIGTDAGTLATSTDGVVWTLRNAFGLTGIRGVAYGNGFYVLAGSLADRVAVSTNAIDWTLVASGTSGQMTGIGYANGRFAGASYQNGVYRSSTAGTYASQADLLDDTLAPAAGTYKVYAAGGYFRLGSRPAGLITCDATQGANAAARTAAQIANNIASRASQSFNATDLTNLDTANSAVCGYWSGLDETTVGAAVDLAAQSVGAWWGVDSAGVFRIKQFTAPSGTAALTITANDIQNGRFNRIATNDPGQGVPNYKVTVRYGRYYQTLTTDLASGVDDATRAAFAQEWRDATTSDATVLTAHPLSQPLIIETLMASASDAATEAGRVLTLRSVKRDLYELVVELNTDTNALDLGSVIELVYPRFGLSVLGSDSSNALFRVIDIRPNAAAQELTLTVWGKATGSRNRITQLGDGSRYRVTSTGAYRVTVN